MRAAAAQRLLHIRDHQGPQMTMDDDRALVDAMRRRAIALDGLDDVEPVLRCIDPRAVVVLFGEATHGTHEFYRLRAELSKRLIVERGFDAIAVEADWPDALRVDAYVRGRGGIESADAAPHRLPRARPVQPRPLDARGDSLPRAHRPRGGA